MTIAYMEKVYNNGDYIERLLEWHDDHTPLDEVIESLRAAAEGLLDVHLATEHDSSDEFGYIYVGVGGHPKPEDHARYKEQWIRERGPR